MRILVFTFQFPPRIGGVEMMAYHLTRYLAQDGNSMIVVTNKADGSLETDANQPYQTIRLDLGATITPRQRVTQKIRWVTELQQIIRSTRPDRILCIHWDPCAYLVRIALALLNQPIPVFLVAHGMEIMRLPNSVLAQWAKKQLRSFGFNGARKIFAVSNYTRTRLLGLGVAPERVLVIPNGVELKDDAVCSTRGERDSAYKRILTVARLVPRKGHAEVIRALPAVLRQIPNVRYQIVGEGPERQRLEALVRELDLGNHVEFFGQVSECDKSRLVQDCDLFVLAARETPEDFEGFGIALAEAMERGKPVIGGRTGGITDVIMDNENGILVDPDSVPDLAAAMLWILKNPIDAKRLGTNAAQQIREKYGWNRIARQYLMAMM